MKDFIARNKEERLRNKVRNTAEFRIFYSKFLIAQKVHPQSWLLKLALKLIPETSLFQWIYNKWRNKMCDQMQVNKVYFNQLSKYL